MKNIQYLVFIRLPARNKEVLSLSHMQLTCSKPRPDRVFVIQPTSRKKVHQQAIISYLPPITPLFSKLFLCFYGPLLSNFWDYLELRRSDYSLYRENVCLVNQLISFSTEKFLVTVVWLIGKHFVHNTVNICQHTSKTIFQNKENICQPIHRSFAHLKRQNILKGTMDAGIEGFKSINDFMFNSHNHTIFCS